MGRGRAKAKQTKVARRLKYYSPETDLNALARELGADGKPVTAHAAESGEDELEEDDAYDRWASSDN
ncbi:DUF3073 domain-containing protein [Ornithinimicrobium ciconiae]|uniref:DUF3073 domain-containing protein n=1 Tax=Ornithinimicrobium ciconiae TaxID=2594265 RepID=A0A516G7P6_9MICO|nr:DUF3073 domain-containing protein [Ornithinimicrobium ciconiae]QDO87502.1 DUF3073 domain-containing protein [Ornithinimicrobium ciconiae]